MFRKLMLAGLMTATIMGGIAPAYAQNQGQQNRNQQNRGEPRRSEGRPDRGDRAPRPATQSRQDGQRWQGRAPGEDRPTAQMAPPRPDSRPGDRPWRRDVTQTPRPPEQPAVRIDRRAEDRWNGRDNRPDTRNSRQDWRQEGRDTRPDWRPNRGDERRADRQGGDRRWNDARADNRHYDDRTRWSSQQRWNNGWRQDRRYDWQSYRSRYGDRYRAGRYYAPRGWDYGYRRFSVGIILSNLLYSNSYWLDDPSSYRLPPAYGTLRWVRYYDDALLVDVRDGYVADVIHNFFW